jgi:hypothetical protein
MNELFPPLIPSCYFLWCLILIPAASHSWSQSAMARLASKGVALRGGGGKRSMALRGGGAASAVAVAGAGASSWDDDVRYHCPISA